MDYRMYEGTITAGDNAIDVIVRKAHSYGAPVCSPFKFIGFEGEGGTEFYLNNSREAMKIPNCGYFITPFEGQKNTEIWSLKFKEDFTGNIYYIIG